ncbi:MAG: ATP-dependent sacrificial sulfur transferase LarE [Nitrospirota bacterium]
MNKLDILIKILTDIKTALLAYSGGVDSTLLLKSMRLAEMRAVAVTAVSEIVPGHEVPAARKMAEEIGIEHRIVETSELSNEDFVRNTPDRCFVCKDNRFRILRDIAISEGYKFVLDGSNLDDAADIRPGAKAAVKHGVRSPLAEAGFSKSDVREYSCQLGLRTWNRPSSSCLATRFPYGQKITGEALRRVAKAEDFLRMLGFREIRVRDHDGVARIEVGQGEIDDLLDAGKRKLVCETLTFFGYRFVSLDLEGYRSGSLNGGMKKSD